MSNKLPIGVQSFEIMRTQGFVYVDKTEWIHRLVTEGMYYFLARPRRFGKSLLVSTLKCLFEGRRDLFEGLWIGEAGRWEWTPHPVVALDFNQISLDTPEELKLGLQGVLRRTAQQYSIDLEESRLVEQWTELLLKLSKQAGQPVVVLIDEYDKPMIEHLGKGEAGLAAARANRDALRGFYGVLKGGDVSAVLRFVLLTGVSRFSRVSIFSALNNLNDISMHPKYADMLGYTQSELTGALGESVRGLAETLACSPEQAVEALARYYNGYRFSRKPVRVYNPFSVLSAFGRQELSSYWFETGTPTFLVNLLREQRYQLPKLEKLEIDQSIFGTFDLDRLALEALLFQTGYLTIRDVQGDLYTLDYPNQEVKTSFAKALLFSEPGIEQASSSHIFQLSQRLAAGDLDGFFTAMTAIFASIPYDIETRRDEAYFHTIFYLVLSASGGPAQSSVLTSRGRIDMLMSLPHHIYILEFKCNQSAASALQQMRAQGYAERYRGGGRPVTLIGVNFSSELRNVAEWIAAPESV